jgi:hypothetical protein
MNMLFLSLKQAHGIINAALLVGLGTSVLAALSLLMIKETFHDDLEFVEH